MNSVVCIVVDYIVWTNTQKVIKMMYILICELLIIDIHVTTTIKNA